MYSSHGLIMHRDLYWWTRKQISETQEDEGRLLLGSYCPVGSIRIELFTYQNLYKYLCIYFVSTYKLDLSSSAPSLQFTTLRNDSTVQCKLIFVINVALRCARMRYRNDFIITDLHNSHKIGNISLGAIILKYKHMVPPDYFISLHHSFCITNVTVVMPG